MYIKRVKIDEFEKANYSVCHYSRDGVMTQYRGVKRDGELIFFIDELRSMMDFIDEVIDGNNEMAEVIGCFTTKKNNTFILWYDWEINAYYLTPVEVK